MGRPHVGEGVALVLSLGEEDFSPFVIYYLYKKLKWTMQMFVFAQLGWEICDCLLRYIIL